MYRPTGFTRLALSLAVFGVAACHVGTETETPPPLDRPLAPEPAAPVAQVEVRGSGPVDMVLIPGSPCDWRVWEAFMERNDDRYTMYAVTLPGFSGTQPPPADEATGPEANAPGATPWLDNAVAALAHFVDEKRLARPAIVGHSLGGHLAMRLGIEHPDRVGAVVSVDGLPVSLAVRGMSAEQRDDQARQLAERLGTFEESERQEMLRQSAEAMVTDPYRADAIHKMFLLTAPEIALGYMVEGMRADLRGRMSLLAAPTLVLAAVPDLIPDEQTANRLRYNWTQDTKDARDLDLRFFEGARHFLMDDRPAELDEAIQGFLAAKLP